MVTTSQPNPSLSARLWNRRLDGYPDTGPRMGYLLVAVLATVVLYYELYVGGGVAPLILAHYKMSFTYYVNILVVSNLVGAFGSLAAGLADRWGRANLVTYGLLLTGLLMFAVPSAPNTLVFAALSVVVGVVEGVILVATPALVRDFSPQLGRATAMGFWTLGPVAGSLVVSAVAGATLTRLQAWQSQFHIVGVVGLVMFAVAFFGLRELSPGLRDQVMVSVRDRAVIEARAKDHTAEVSHPWRQMMGRDIVAPALGISIFLLIYYSAVAFFTIYLTTIFGFSTSEANGINTWYWAIDGVVLVAAGIASDRLRVRKPFMIVGTVVSVTMTIVFLSRATHPDTGYGTLVLIISLLAGGLAIAYAPWMAAFTETIERRNPALTATGLAVWGWLLRMVVTASLFFVPYVVSSMNALVEAPAYLEAAKAAGASPPPALLEKLGEIKSAAAAAPGQWQTWFWICVIAQVLFVPLMLPLAGRWSPKAARAEVEAHDRDVERLLGSGSS
ncbi:MFS transporter [Sphaerisporangium corydalis]|uniref:MFS transporter n=1 Tax=Sphaerisporangium corydalis TaxID=1441875 RepID=A0ABV9ET93_9ACTN|nr:MFS transporter [Sphaerisporangium corydalis]